MILPEILDANLHPVRRIQPIKASVRLNLTPLSTAEFDLYPGETIPARSLIAMYTVQGFAGVYRSSTPNETYGNRATRVHLEHAVAEIGDWIVGSEVEETIVTAASAISSLFASYGGTLWSLGTLNCSVNVRFSASKGQNVLEAILGIVSQVPGYMLTLDQTVTPWQIGIALQPETVTAEGRLSRNMQSVQITYDESELCNKVYISGIDMPFEALESQQKYGVIEHYLSETDLPAATAQMVALAYLQAHCDPAISVNISMLDLANVTGEPLDRITLGAKFRIALPKDGVSIEQHVIGIQFEDVYGNPEAINVTLANEISDTVAYLKKQRRSGRAGQRRTEKLAEEAIQQYHHYATETDVYKQSIYEITGVMLDDQGRVAYEVERDAQGNIIYEEDGVTPVFKRDEAGNRIPIFNPQATGSISGKVTETAQNYTRLYERTGVSALGNDVTLYSKIVQNATGMQTIYSQTVGVNAVFDPTVNYKKGDMVLYEGIAYQFTAAHPAGEWTGQDATTAFTTLQAQITENATEISRKVSQGDLAGYMKITAMQSAFGNSAVAADGTITKAEFSTSVVDGIAEAGVTAEKIKLTGGDSTVKLSDRVIVADAGYTIIKGQLSVLTGTGQNQKTISLNNGKVTAISGFQVGSGGSLSFVGGEDQLTKTINYSELLGMIKTASLDSSTNTLTLTKFDGTVINFSKAATPVTLAGLWSGSTYTATPSAGNSVSTTVSLKTVSDLIITSTDSQIQDHGKFVTASGTVTIRATTGNLDGQGNPEYVDVLTSSFSGRDITDAYNEGWEAGNAAPSTTTVTGSWSGGTYTATAMPQNVQAETSLYGIVLNGDITKNTVIPKAINVPLRVVYDDGDPQTDAADKPSTGFTESISVDASMIYADGQNSVSATFGTYSGTPGTATELSAGAYEFKVTKDGTTTTQTFYTVPAAPSPVVPKVSKGTWQNGSITFTAGTAGDDTSTLKLYTSGAYSGTLDNVQNPTKVSFSILEDTGNGTTAATGATIFANISTTTGTLKLGNFNETNNTITVSLDTKPSVNVGGSSAIQPGVTQKDIVIARGTAQPNTPTWNSTAHTYTITADGGFTVGGKSITQTQGSITGGFAPEDAIEYGKNLAKGIASLTVSQTSQTAWNNATQIPTDTVTSDGYYFVTATPVQGAAVQRKFHVPASGGGGTSDRWARYLNPITLDAADTGTVTKYSLATYSDGETEPDETQKTSVEIDASAVYQAGVTAGLGGVVNVEKTAWNAGYAKFKPSAGNGSEYEVRIQLEPVVVSLANANTYAHFNLIDAKHNNEAISGQLTYYLSRNAEGTYAYLKTNQYLPSNNNVIAKVALNGTPGGEDRSVESLSEIILTASDIGISTKTTNATFNVGDPQADVSIRVDASAVYSKGLTDGSRYRIETEHVEPQALTRNNYTYSIYPTSGWNAMAKAKFTVQVPTYEGISSAKVNHSDDTASTSWDRQLGNGTLNKKYAEIMVTANDGTTKGYFLDASALYERGVTDGSGGTYHQRTATDIDDITLTASQTGSSTHRKTVYYDSGANSTLSVTVNAGNVYQQGRIDGMNNIPKTAITCSNTVKSIGTNRGSRDNAGSISKSGLTAQSYLGFTIKVQNTVKEFYIAVNP